MIVMIVIGIIIIGIGAWCWVTNIDYMRTKYPDYKGEDLFEDDEDDKKPSTAMVDTNQGEMADQNVDTQNPSFGKDVKQESVSNESNIYNTDKSNKNQIYN